MKRDLPLLAVVALAFFVAFLIAPDESVSRANRQCADEAEQVFESMQACSVGQQPGCVCYLPDNIGLLVFWLIVLGLLGLGASILLRSRFAPAAAMLGVALALGGACAMFVFNRRDTLSPEEWVAWPFFIAIQGAIVILVFGVCRRFAQWRRGR